MIAAFLKKNKLLIAILSLIGSVAGVGFSASDVHDELQRRKKLNAKKSTKP
jgi:hypothetical protein